MPATEIAPPGTTTRLVVRAPGREPQSPSGDAVGLPVVPLLRAAPAATRLVVRHVSTSSEYGAFRIRFGLKKNAKKEQNNIAHHAATVKTARETSSIAALCLG